MQHAGGPGQQNTLAKTKRQLNLEGILDDEKHAELSQIFRNISIEGMYIQDASFKLRSQSCVITKLIKTILNIFLPNHASKVFEWNIPR